MPDDLIHDRGVIVPMRDRIRLVADVTRPNREEPVPVLLMRTPYGRSRISLTFDVESLAREGFAVVIQDCRGRFDSEGEFAYVRGEIEDGYDTVEWAAVQPWSNGRVGMFGQSYMGNTQWMAAISGAPHLHVIAPEICPADLWTGNFDTGGMFRLGLRLSWTAGIVAAMATNWGIDDERLRELEQASGEVAMAEYAGDHANAQDAARRARAILYPLYQARPVGSSDVFHGRVSVVDELMEHEGRADAWWRRISPMTYFDVIDLPALHIGGWYDIHIGGTLTNFAEMRRQAPSDRARDGQRLVVGPWSHGPTGARSGDVDFGASAAIDVGQLRLPWFRHWLQDGPEPGWAPVRIFVMGENVWRDELEWPLARTVYTPWYLHQGGGLSPEAPSTDSEPDRFVFDPRDPVPTIGGRLLSTGDPAGPRDQRPTFGRPDVVLYRSEPLESPLEITGPVIAELWAATDAPDTDFTATLIDEHPDGGPALNLCESGVRARHLFRVPLAPGAVYPFTIDLVATSAVVGVGHRLSLLVSCSRFPEWEPNPNTGRPLGVDAATDLRSASQAVFHDSRHPSRVVLPVIPRDW